MNKLQRIEEMEKQLAALKAEVQSESKTEEWQPAGGEHTVFSDGTVGKAPSGNEHRLFGVEYQTAEQAEKASAAMRSYNRLLAYTSEFDKEWVADWNDPTQHKYCVFMDSSVGLYKVSYVCNNKHIGTVYMSGVCARDLADKLNKGLVKL